MICYLTQIVENQVRGPSLAPLWYMSPFRLYTDGICWRKIYIPMVYVGIKFIYRWYIGHIPMVYCLYTDGISPIYRFSTARLVFYQTWGGRWAETAIQLCSVLRRVAAIVFFSISMSISNSSVMSVNRGRFA